MKLFVCVCAAMLVLSAQAQEQKRLIVKLNPEWLNETLSQPTVHSWKSCGSASDKASNLNLVISPAAPQPGDTVSFTSSYTLSEAVTGGTATYKATLNGFPIVSKSEDLCTSLKSGKTPCPLAKGSIKSTTTTALPTSIPAGSFVGTQTWTDQNGAQIFCLQYTFTFN